MHRTVNQQVKHSERGFFDKESQTLLIMPITEVYEDTTVKFFATGRSGADGIDFGYRKRHEGLWVYYSIDDEFKYMAESIIELKEGWCSGKLFV